MKGDVLLLTCVFEKINSIKNRILDKSFFGAFSYLYTFQCGMKYTGKILQTIQYKELFFLLENHIRGGKSRVRVRIMISVMKTKRFCKVMQIIYMVGQ